MTHKGLPEKTEATKQKAVEALQRLEQTLLWLDAEFLQACNAGVHDYFTLDSQLPLPAMLSEKIIILVGYPLGAHRSYTTHGAD